VRKQSLIEIVPTEPAIAVHVVPSSPERSCVTFFTTGMSTTPMKVPAGEDSEYAHAELYIELPADWKYMEIADADFGWPIHWLRWLAKYPHQQGAWLGGPVTIAAREEPPQPMAPSVPFTSMLLLADRHLKRSDGKTIQFYRLTPLYTEERELEMREGIAAPMQAFDRLDISFVVDVNRQNVCRSDR